MSMPKPHDRVHVAARFMRLPAIPTTEAFVRINTAAGAVDVKVSQDALLTTEGKPFDWNPSCNSLLFVESEGAYFRCKSTNHPSGKHWAPIGKHWAPNVEWDDDDPNAVRVKS